MTDQPVDERAPDGPEGDAPATSLEDELERRQEQYLRLAADFDNFRKRKTQELEDRARYASEAAATALLPVLDNLRRAVEHANTDDETSLRSGIEMVVREFESALETLGIVPIEAVGEPFDPKFHEAIAGEESEDVDVETVVDEVQRGYRLHDRVLRPALVRVAHPARTGTA